MDYEPPTITEYQPCQEGVDLVEHVCLLPPGHPELHYCQCGLRWEWDYTAFPGVRESWVLRHLRHAP